MKKFLILVSILMFAPILEGCEREKNDEEIEIVTNETNEDEVNATVDDATREEDIDAILELIQLYELDIECLKDSSAKSSCFAIHDEETFNQTISKIVELQEKLLKDYNYEYTSQFVGSSYSSVSNKKDTLVEKGTCKEIDGKYTSQGLSIIDCSYSSSKDKISITVKNNSGVDLRYLEVEIYGIDKNGNTISSDYTNHGSTIRDGAIQILETYVDYAYSYEVEITKATPKY